MSGYGMAASFAKRSFRKRTRSGGEPRSWGCFRCAAIRDVTGGPHLGVDALRDLYGRNIRGKPLCAWRATARAMVVATSRNALTGGSKLCFGFSRAGEELANAFAAAMNIPSLTRFAPTASAPRPIPGKM